MPLISSDFARGTPTGCSRRRRAQRDALTGLASRWLFEERLSDALQSAQKTGRQLGLLVVDCDNFKRVNNLLGHDAGDDVLVEIASRLRAAVRSFDSVARMGGDGFMILLDRLQGAKEAMELAQGVLHALGEPLVLVGQTAHTTASLGLCVYPEDGATAEELLRNADAAMYQAKTEGRNRVQRFTPEMERSLARRRELEAALEQALTRDEFELVYQPRVLVQTGEVTGVEALLRWRSSRLGLVMPGEFIAIAEENGLIVPIGKWVLDTACREMRQISKDMGKDLPFAVNVSPRQFQQESLAGDIAAALARHEMEAEQMEVEITENLLLHVSPRSLETFEEVRALGVSIAIDDFGTGYSNMSYLTRFRADRLKIDQSFVRRMSSNQGSDAICKAIIGLANALRITVVAEGVESRCHNDMLSGLGCDEAQGYFYGRPVSLAELPAVLRLIGFGTAAGAAA